MMESSTENGAGRGLRSPRATGDTSTHECQLRMRRFFLFALSLSAAAACGSSSDGSGGTTTPGGPSSTAYSLSADSTFQARTALIGSALPTTVHVELGGVPAANVTVNWFPNALSGTVSSKTSTTDANGNASVTWTLSDTVRVNTLTATAGTGSVNVTAATTPGPVTTLTKASADSTSLVAGASTILTVRATDPFGNRVPGVAIAWSTSGGSLSATSSTTGSAGNADIVFSTTGAPASYSVTAASGSLPAVSFKVVGF